MLLFITVILSWGTMWVVIKVIVAEVSPLWAIAIRNGAAAIGLALLLAVMGRFVFPRKGDWPIVLVVSLFHMTAFAVLMTIGLQPCPSAARSYWATRRPYGLLPPRGSS